MTDTAQPMAADPESQLQDAANAFKDFLTPQPSQPRDDSGRFATAAEEEIIEEEEVETPDIGESDDDETEVDEAADEAQPDAANMPSSWGNDDAELWSSLPAEAQAKIAEREAQRDAGLNAKLQEAANARKAVEAQAEEANANRDAYAQAIQEVVGLLQYPEPSPMDFGAGTTEYDRESYDIALHQWKQMQSTLGGLLQQRQAIVAQQQEEAEQARQAAFSEVEEVAWPKFVADVPELRDPAKGRQIVADIIEYAIEQGLPREAFQVGTVNSNEMRMLWKAKEYDRIKAAGNRVKAGNPPPKPATPAVKPGGATTRQTVQANRLSRARDRLAKEGSVEAGAEMFKHFLSR